QSPEMTGPLIGASGAIAGAMGGFLVLFATVRIKFAYWLGFFWGTFAAPAWLLLPLWFVGELASARLMDVAGASDGVAYWAHVGGFGYGVLVAGLMRLCGADAWMLARNTARNLANAEPEDSPSDAPEHIRTPEAPAAHSFGRLWTAVAKVDRAAALREWSKLTKAGLKVSGGDADVTLRLAGWLAATGQQTPASTMLAELLPRCDTDVVRRIAGVARRIDPELAVRAAARLEPGTSSGGGPQPIGKVALTQRRLQQPAAANASAQTPVSDVSARSGPSVSSPASTAAIDDQDLDLFEVADIDFTKDDEALVDAELEVDLGLPGSHGDDSSAAAELFDSEAFDFSEE
ncbi:MAG: rhomboid family intramembrane serine protease, partial [bacterium]|nr:rhomboid family intramembrane serine protease [bacterium]